VNILVPHGFEANYTVGFAKGLAANGLTLQVVTDDDTAGPLRAAHIAQVNLRGAQNPDRSRGQKLRALAGYYFRLLRHLGRHRGSTVHFTGIFRDGFVWFEGVFLHLGMKLLARRYIYTAHNLLPHNRANSRLFFWIYRFIYAVPDTIVVHTPALKTQLMQRFQVPERKIQVISIGLNDEVPSTTLDRAQARALLGASPDENWILFFGKIDEYKGVDRLVDAFSALDVPRARLLIAGAFRSPEYERSLRRQIAASPRAGAIRLDARNIPNAEVEISFKACEVLCLPYRNVYQSGLLFLAGRFGIPLVTTNVGSLAESVTPECGLVTETNDAPGIRRALERFFQSPERFDRARIAAAAAELSWDRVCRKILFLYESPVTAGAGRKDPAAADAPSQA
jgi:glycosyltransferase involved in cell wall biosynthesis